MVIVASPFTKAKRSNCDMLDRNELQTYASLKKMLHNFCYSSTQREGKHQHFFCTKTTIFVSIQEGQDEEQNRGHEANQERSSSIQKPDQTQDLRTNLFEEGGNDVPQSMDQYMEPA
uniref:Uncharacterized protein n=1 Tax=Brassica oleracea var. oleracea TaxID=109376 RepID=A0A0D3E9R2_BRAOL